MPSSFTMRRRRGRWSGMGLRPGWFRFHICSFRRSCRLFAIWSGSDLYSDLAIDRCWRVDAGAAEEEQLAAALLLLSREREAGVEIGRRAALHIGREHGIARVAELYWSILRKPDGSRHRTP